MLKYVSVVVGRNHHEGLITAHQTDNDASISSLTGCSSWRPTV